MKKLINITREIHGGFLEGIRHHYPWADSIREGLKMAFREGWIEGRAEYNNNHEGVRS